jgi:hypothetical protein
MPESLGRMTLITLSGYLMLCTKAVHTSRTHAPHPLPISLCNRKVSYYPASPNTLPSRRILISCPIDHRRRRATLRLSSLQQTTLSKHTPLGQIQHGSLRTAPIEEASAPITSTPPRLALSASEQTISSEATAALARGSRSTHRLGNLDARLRVREAVRGGNIAAAPIRAGRDAERIFRRGGIFDERSLADGIGMVASSLS